MALSIGIPFLLVWVIAFPLLAFYKIQKNKKNLNDLNFLKRFGLFYVGLNDDSYFWEVLINNSRKIIFIMTSNLFDVQQMHLKALIGILTLFA
jgi:hypothetical protein